MTQSLLYRLFKLGRMPRTISDELAAETILFEIEGIRVALHMSGRVPGAVTARGVRFGRGAFAATSRRVVGTWGNSCVVDVPFGIDQPDGPATLTLTETGLQVHWDLDRVHPRCHGAMRLEYRAEIPQTQLAALPGRELTFRVDPQAVVRMFGSRRKLPT